MGKRLLLFFVFLLLWLTACTELGLATKIHKVRQHKIILPEVLLCIDNGSESLVHEDDETHAQYIVYIDSSECKTCILTHPEQFEALYHIQDAYGSFGIKIILSPGTDYLSEVVEEIRNLNLTFPIYLDIENKFKKLNAFLPDDYRFHSFLLDKQMKPIFLGSPFANKNAKALFEKKLHEIYRH